MIRCILIANKRAKRQELIKNLRSLPQISLVAIVDTAMAAVARFETGTIDLAICEMVLPDFIGIDFLKSLNNPPLFIFFSDKPDYAADAFACNAVDYLVKPISFQRLLQAIDKANMLLQQHRLPSQEYNFLVIQQASSQIFIPYEEIYYIESDRDYIHLITLDREYCIWHTLSAMEERLAACKAFIRVHKSFIINLNFIRYIKFWKIHLKLRSEIIPIGPNYRAALWDRLGLRQ